MVSAYVRDITGALQLAWYNMPYMRANIKAGRCMYSRRSSKKTGPSDDEAAQVFTEEAYETVVNSMQPVYGQTRGLAIKPL